LGNLNFKNFLKQNRSLKKTILENIIKIFWIGFIICPSSFQARTYLVEKFRDLDERDSIDGFGCGMVYVTSRMSKHRN